MGGVEQPTRTILNNDNTSMRRLMEQCVSHAKTVLNPIVDWEDEDIWEFIHTENIPYCELYDCGYKRLGCIGCPMKGTQMAADLERWPKYKEMYLLTFDKMLRERAKANLPTDKWETPDDVMTWYMGMTPLPAKMREEYQLALDDFNNPYDYD